MKAKRVRVKLRRVRRAVAELWADSIDPVDRLVARTVLSTELSPALQVRLLRTWFSLR